MGPAGGGAAGSDGRPAPGAPDPVLVGAAAMVFVADPAAPQVDDADVRHLLDVLRLRAGELVAVSDGAGRWAPCRVAADAPARAGCTVSTVGTASARVSARSVWRENQRGTKPAARPMATSTMTT